MRSGGNNGKTVGIHSLNYASQWISKYFLANEILSFILSRGFADLNSQSSEASCTRVHAQAQNLDPRNKAHTCVTLVKSVHVCRPCIRSYTGISVQCFLILQLQHAILYAANVYPIQMKQPIFDTLWMVYIEIVHS